MGPYCSRCGAVKGPARCRSARGLATAAAGLGGVVSSSVLDEERWTAVEVVVDLDGVRLMPVADEVDVVVVAWVGDLQSLDHESGHLLAELVEYVVDRPAGAVGVGPWAAGGNDISSSRRSASSTSCLLGVLTCQLGTDIDLDAGEAGRAG